jgi:HEPN domain-containing protein
VQAAAAKHALWTTAEEAMRLAQAAFLRGEYPEAIHAAQTAAEQAQLGIAQTQYPMFQLPKL